MAKNVIIGQSGGPTAVINSSLAGVYKAACSLGANKVYGMKYGIEGLLKEELIELNVLLDDRMSIELLKRTPSSYLGSCRYKLPEPEQDSTPYVKLFTLFEKYDICALFYIGGNDSMDTIAKLSRYGAQVGSSVRFIGVPKTIDNDLCLTDHTPGYGSAAKYIATILKEASSPTSSLPPARASRPPTAPICAIWSPPPGSWMRLATKPSSAAPAATCPTSSTTS